MFYLSIAFLLSVFWIVLSGHFDPLLLGLGLGSVGLVVLFLRRMDKADLEPAALFPNGRMLRYLFWLGGCVVRSNIDVARRIWHPALPIELRWSRIDTALKSPLEKSIYANSITLTPGTLTTDVHEDHLFVHSLSQEGIDELRDGEMERRISRIGL